jgi:hypothetical protein
MNDANVENKFNALLREMEKMNKVLGEIRDRLPESLHYTLMEK